MPHKILSSRRGPGAITAFTVEEEIAIARRVLAGEKKYVIAEELGVHRNTISNICKRLKEAGLSPKVKKGAKPPLEPHGEPVASNSADIVSETRATA